MGEVVVPVERIQCVVGVVVRVDGRLEPHQRALLRIQRVNVIAVGLYGFGRSGGQIHVPGAALGRDDDHAVSGPRAVDAGAGRITQHLDRIDVVWIELLQTGRGVERDAVDDEQGRVEAEQAETLAADLHRGGGTRISVGEDLHPGHLALQILEDVAYRTVLGFREIHYSYSADDILFLFHRVACRDHDLLELLAGQRGSLLLAGLRSGGLLLYRLLLYRLPLCRLLLCSLRLRPADAAEHGTAECRHYCARVLHHTAPLSCGRELAAVWGRPPNRGIAGHC